MDRPEDLKGCTESPLLRGATVTVLTALETLLKNRVSVKGKDRLPKGPILFVANHFTRVETFLLPWIIDRFTGRKVSCLAWEGLFHGKFGCYLNSVGARSTKEPGIKERMIQDLAHNRCDWMIYPEGEMVKNKRVWANGRLELDTPSQHGPPHTGAALVALRAALLQKTLPGKTFPVHVIPVSVTYYPLRPADNLILKLARKLARALPTGVEEELLVEGALLLKRTDIDVQLGEPIELGEWMKRLPLGIGLPGDRVPSFLRTRLTTRMMQDVYQGMTRNVDHLFCGAIRNLKADAIAIEDLHRSMFLAARESEQERSRNWHPSTGPVLLDALCGLDPVALRDIQSLAVSEGLAAVSGGALLRHRDGFRPDQDYHNVRLRHTIEVISNEIQPDRELIRALRRNVNLPSKELRRRAAIALEKADLQEHLRENGHSESAPFLFSHPNAKAAILVVHGYLASPLETMDLARHLYSQGASVYCARLPGHGSTPEMLEAKTWTDWWRGLQRGLALLKCLHTNVSIAGFSTGGLLALLAAARHTDVRQVCCINTPTNLANRASLAAPAVAIWNRLARKLGIPRARLPFVTNDTEYPATNYLRNPVEGIRQLRLLIAAVRSEIGAVHCPVLVLQADHDPVVLPSSGREIFDSLPGAQKILVQWPSSRHGIVRGEGAQQVWEHVSRFLIRP